MRKSNRSSALALWIGFALVCFLIVVSVLVIQFRKPEQVVPAVATPAPTAKPLIKFDIISDVDQAPIRRLLEVMLPHRITLKELQVLSHQIRNALNHQDYKYISIRYQIPEMPYSHGIWGKAAFKYAQPEEIEILGMTISKLIGFKNAPLPEAEKILGTWIIEETANVTRKVSITRDKSRYSYLIQWSPESEYFQFDLEAIDGESRFIYLDRSEDNIYTIRSNGDLELASPEGVFAIGHPIDSYLIPGEQ
jgi:hypothetical protein